MFVGWRDLRFAAGRFALVGGVVVLVTVLIGLLSGLTEGLARQNTSAILGLPADRIALAAPPEGDDPSFADSVLDETAWLHWAEVPGVRAAEPLGIATVRAGDRRGVTLAAFGVRPGSGLHPAAAALGAGRVALSAPAAAELDVVAGDRIVLGDHEVAVVLVGGDDWYAHLPVVWTGLEDWQDLVGTADRPHATAVALSTTGDGPTGERPAGTVDLPPDEAVFGIGSFAAENASLRMVQGFLYAICALVVGAFFSIWTIQRGADVAVLKALGAATAVLLRDAVAQAAVVLLTGAAVGGAIVVALGRLIGTGVPFVLDARTVLLPAAVVVTVGVAGAALAVRRLVRIDPLAALGGAR